MYAYQGDVLWDNGRDGGYLVLGNIVYTVSREALKPHVDKFFIYVKRSFICSMLLLLYA